MTNLKDNLEMIVGMYRDANSPLRYAHNAVMWDDRRHEIVPVLMSRFGLTEEQSHELTTAAQQGYLMRLEAANPEAWEQLGLSSLIS